MRRREFLGVLGGAAATWPHAARGQQAGTPVIGFLNAQSPEPFAPFVQAYLQGLNELGYTAGRNVAIEYRWAWGRPGQVRSMATELVERRVSVLVTTGGEEAAVAGKSATSSIPLVFLIGGDPVRVGLVPAYNRPGGNVTGATLLSATLDVKRLGLLREMLPKGARIALLVNPNLPSAEARKNDVLAAARDTGHEIVLITARDPGEIDSSFKKLASSAH